MCILCLCEMIVATDNTTKNLPRLTGLHPVQCAEKGIFGMGNPQMDEAALEFITQRGTLSADSELIVVYGTGWKALCILGMLELHEVKRSRIVWVTSEARISDVENEEVSFSYNDYYFSLFECAMVDDEFIGTDDAR